MNVVSLKRISEPYSDNLKSAIQNPKWWGIFAFSLALVFGGFEARAQEQRKIPRIGYLSNTDPDRDSARATAFKLALRDLGYIEGKSVAIEYRDARGGRDRQRKYAAELASLPVNLIFATSTTMALAAKSFTKAIPIIFLSATEPVTSGLVKSLARPSGNLTGFATIAAALAGKRLELLKETLPNLTRLAILWQPQNKGSEESWKESQLAARQLGLKIHSMEVSSPDKFESAFGLASKANSDALAVTLSSLFSLNRKLIVSLAAKHRLPAIYTRDEFADRGGLMSYGADEGEPFKRIGVMIDKILKGAKPADLPVEQPTKFELVINLRTAKQIGLTIPPNVLERADRVIR